LMDDLAFLDLRATRALLVSLALPAEMGHRD